MFINPPSPSQLHFGSSKLFKLGRLVMELNFESGLFHPCSLSSRLVRIPITSGSFPPLFAFFVFFPCRACENLDLDCSFNELAGAGTITVCDLCTVPDLAVGAGLASLDFVSTPPIISAHSLFPSSSGVGTGSFSILISAQVEDVLGREAEFKLEEERGEKTRRSSPFIALFELDAVLTEMTESVSFPSHSECRGVLGGVDSWLGRKSIVENLLSIFSICGLGAFGSEGESLISGCVVDVGVVSAFCCCVPVLVGAGSGAVS